MSKYVFYYNTRQAAYREMALRWVKLEESANLAPYEMMGIKRFFRQIARRFGLITEFRSIGVI